MRRAGKAKAPGVLLAGALALGAGVRPAAAQFVPYYGKNKVVFETPDWRLYRSAHFDVHFEAGEERALEKVVDLAERAYGRLAGELDHEVRFRIPLIVYRTHAEFEQTRVLDTLIDEGIGGFAEPALNRMVLPLEGTEHELERLVTHELTHIFEFSMVYRGLRPQLLVRRPPQWAFEGFADFMSHDDDALERMLLRDLVLHDQVPRISTLEFSELPNPVLGYKLGQAAFEAVRDRWGMAGVRRLWWGFRKSTLVSHAVPWETAFDVDDREFDRTVEKWLRRSFPIDGTKERTWAFERRLELERPLEQAVALAPSPSGDALAVLAFNRVSGELDLVVVSARDGTLLANLTPGTTAAWDYLALDGRVAEGRPVAWDRSGRRIAVFARSGARRELLVFDAASGSVVTRRKPPCDAAQGVTFTPDGSQVVFAGLAGDRTDLFRMDLGSGETQALTDDALDDRTPAMSPDGTLVWVTSEHGFDHLVRRSPGSDERERLTAGEWNDTSPWFDPAGDLYYVSDRGGAPNLWRIRKDAASTERLSDAATGCFSPVRLAGPDAELAFVSYDRGVFGIYVDPRSEVRETVPLAPEETRRTPLVAAGRPALDPAAVGRPGRRLHLTGLSELQAGISSDGTLFGEATARFEDVLGERRVMIALRSVSEFRSFYGRFSQRVGRSDLVLQGYDLASYFFADPQLALAGRPEDAGRRVETRVAGGSLGLQHAFSLYRRAEVGLGVEYRERDFRSFDADVPLLTDGTAVPVRGSLVLETTRFRSFGPITGRTYRFAGAFAPRAGELLGFGELEGDLRQYLQLSRESLLALRAWGYRSDGHDPQFRAFGGESEFRGADYNSFSGTRGFFGNAELRFPLLDLVKTPVLSLDDVRGTLYLDVAGAWTEGSQFRFFRKGGGPELEDAVAVIGGGVQVGFLGIPLHVDFSWPTDLDSIGDNRVSAWLGFDY